MLQILTFILLVAIGYGFLLSATSHHSVWIPVGIYVVTMVILILCNHFYVGYTGGSDAAGNGMERGFLAMFYHACMILASIAFLVSLLLWFFKYRHVT